MFNYRSRSYDDFERLDGFEEELDFEENNGGGYRPPGKRTSGFKKFVTRVFWGGAAILGAGFAAGWGYYAHLAGQEDIDKVGKMPERSLVFDYKGELIGRLHGANRIVVPLEAVSPYFQDALLAREDSRFYQHGGVDYPGVARAIARNLKDWEYVQGASTLTMQLARVSYDVREKTLNRKLLEMMLAQRIERRYSKKEILAFYMNRIYFGTGLYGVERASQAYFNKHAKEMNLSEAAMLAGIIRAPNRFSPFRHYEDAILERNTVLDRMLQLGYITPKEADEAKKTHIAIGSPEESRSFENSYAMDLVRRDLDLILEAEETEDGGLMIHTTIDTGMQHAAEAAVEKRLATVEAVSGYEHQTRADYVAARQQNVRVAPEYLQGAVVAIDNHSGGIRAIVGGRSFEESQYNRASMGKRQIGSLFKPFVYAAAYQKGLLPGTYVSDEPLKDGEVSWKEGNWSPRNSDGAHLGDQPAEIGLIKSRNTMTVRVGEIAGIDPVIDLARHAGLEPPAEKSPQIYIGNIGADLRSVTSAFSTFPRDGYKMRTYVIESIQDRRGSMLYQNTSVGYRLMPAGAAWLSNQTLQKAMEPGGTGSQARTLGLKGPVGGKTGTTNDYHDAWFVGYNDKVTCGVWVGLDQPVTIADRGYGGTLALPIWTDVMMHAASHGYPTEEFKTELQLVNVQLCRVSGGLANFPCQRNETAYQLSLPYELVPRGGCTTHGWFDKDRREGDPTRPGLFDRLKNLFK